MTERQGDLLSARGCVPSSREMGEVAHDLTMKLLFRCFDDFVDPPDSGSDVYIDSEPDEDGNYNAEAKLVLNGQEAFVRYSECVWKGYKESIKLAVLRIDDLPGVTPSGLSLPFYKFLMLYKQRADERAERITAGSIAVRDERGKILHDLKEMRSAVQCRFGLEPEAEMPGR